MCVLTCIMKKLMDVFFCFKVQCNHETLEAKNGTTYDHPGVNLINFFPSSLMTRPNKLEGLSLVTLSSKVLEWGQGQSKPNWRTFQILPSWVSSWCYQQMLDWTGKWLPGTNTLANWASLSARKKKSFITLTPGVNLIKLFFCIIHSLKKKAKALSLLSPHSLVYRLQLNQMLVLQARTWRVLHLGRLWS